MTDIETVDRPGRWAIVQGMWSWIEGHARELCEHCGAHPVPATATQFSCEHTTVNLRDVDPPQGAAPVAEPVEAGQPQELQQGGADNPNPLANPVEIPVGQTVEGEPVVDDEQDSDAELAPAQVEQAPVEDTGEPVPGDEDGDGAVTDADTAAVPADAPAKRASKAEWVDYLSTKGMDRGELNAKTKPELIQLAAGL